MTTARRYDFATICAATNEVARHRHPGESPRAAVNRVLSLCAEQLRLLAEIELERRDRWAEPLPAPRRSSRPAYVTGSRGRADGPKLAAVRVTAATPAGGLLFAELEADRPAAAYVATVDVDGRPFGHRSGPLPLEDARRLAARKAGLLGLELEDLTA